MSHSSKINESYINDLFQKIVSSDRIALSQGITLVESQNKEHEKFAQTLVDQCFTKSGNAKRIGITGTPGVGKSTFIEKIGLMLIEKGHRVAVLTIDPTSPLNQGSILGDKSRMDKLSHHSTAYVRSSPTRSTLGGTTDRTRETIVLCEAAQYDVIIIETVGVGQSETEIMNMTDLLLLLSLPGGGDELQGIKRGIVEVADMIVINKVDKFEEAVVKDSQNAFRFALHLNPVKENGWKRNVYSCSAFTGKGMDDILDDVHLYFDKLKENGQLESRREKQNEIWLKRKVEQEVLKSLKLKLKEEQILNDVLIKIRKKEWSINKAAQNILQKLQGKEGLFK